MILCKNCGFPEENHRFPHMCKKFEPKPKEDLTKTLEQLCPFAETCAESNHGSEDMCITNYYDCKPFNYGLKKEIENYSIPKLINKEMENE